MQHNESNRNLIGKESAQLANKHASQPDSKMYRMEGLNMRSEIDDSATKIVMSKLSNDGSCPNLTSMPLTERSRYNDKGQKSSKERRSSHRK